MSRLLSGGNSGKLYTVPSCNILSPVAQLHILSPVAEFRGTYPSPVPPLGLAACRSSASRSLPSRVSVAWGMVDRCLVHKTCVLHLRPNYFSVGWPELIDLSGPGRINHQYHHDGGCFR